MRLSLALFLAGLAAVLSACTVEVEEGPIRPGPVACPMIYQPVCATRGGAFKTFGNGCQARAEGWRTIADGQCRVEEPAPISCPRIYDPQCATLDGRLRVFPNSCVATAEGWDPIPNRVCRRSGVGEPRPLR